MGNVGRQVRLLALDGRNAELAGGLSSNPILSGLRRTAINRLSHETVPLTKVRVSGKF